MRILLVHPPFQMFRNLRNTDFPIGLGYIASTLLHQGYDVRIYNGEYGGDYLNISRVSQRLEPRKITLDDMNARPYQEFKKAIEYFEADVVGISAYSQSFKVVVNLSKIVKMLLKDCLVVVGGPHATVEPDSLLKIPSIDVVVTFEGEHAMLSTVKNVEARKKTFENIPGVMFKANGVVVRNNQRLRNNDLDSLPFPARNICLNSASKPKAVIKRDNSVMITSRGCPYACRFCSSKNVWCGKVTYRSIENVIRELKEFYDFYGSTEMMFWDDSFTLQKSRVLDFCKKYAKSNTPISWKAQTRVNIVDYDLLKAMRDAGCSTLYFGIESGSQRVLDIINKKITIKQVHKAIEATERVGLSWACSFIFGVPGETIEDMKATLDLMNQIHPSNISLLSFTPFPGTEFYYYESVKKVLATVNYYDVELFSDPVNFTGTMSDEEFNRMKQVMFDYVDRYNSKRNYITALKEKIRNPIYYKHPTILLSRAFERIVYRKELQGW